MIFCCNSSRDLYTMPPPTKANKVFAFLSTVVTTEVWHYLLGHPGRDATTALQRMPTIPPDKLSSNLCHACQIGKQVRLPFSTSTSVTTSAFDLIHCDLWTSSVMSTSGYQYYMVIVDDFSHYFWCFPLVIKSDAFATIQFFFAHVDTQFHAPIRAFQTDNGKEFVNHASTTFFDSLGVQLRLSCPYSSPQNGKVERASGQVITIKSCHIFLPRSKLWWFTILSCLFNLEQGCR
jgi:hypothetical protein